MSCIDQEEQPSSDGATWLLQCPFARRDPRKYGTVKGCAGPGWEDTQRVKEHIYRTHCLRIFCPRCFKCFATAGELNEHIRGDEVCQIATSPPDGMCTKGQEQRLRSLCVYFHPVPEGEQWRKVFQILFPGETVPSPFLGADRDPVIPDPNIVIPSPKGYSPISLDLSPLEEPEELIPFEAWKFGRHEIPLEVLLSMPDQQFGLDYFPPDLHANPTTSATSRQPPTMYGDSGYASLGTQSVAPKVGELERILAETEPARRAVNTAEEAQETGTVFSDAASLLQHPDVDKYISVFTQQLTASISPEVYKSYLDVAPSRLEHLLESFAVRLGHESPGRPQRQLMYLVYRFRREIVRRFTDLLRTQDNFELESTSETGEARGASPSTDPGMTLDEKIMMWGKESNGSGHHNADNCEGRNVDHTNRDILGDAEDFDGFDDFQLPELATYREILAESSAYQWLKSSLRANISLQVPQSDIHIANHHVGDKIISAARSNKILSRKRTQKLMMHLIVDWDPVVFAEEQQYDAPLSCVLAQAITLTGHGNNLQAATCESYLKQTWPESGPQILSLLQTAVQGGPNERSDLRLPDETHLIAQLNERKLHLTVDGNVFSVAEVAEQVAWIAAALRSSPADTAAAYTTAYVTDLLCSIPSEAQSVDQIITIGRCNIKFRTEILRDTDWATTGSCWRGIFGNPVIVRGYPIRRRAEANSGLEIPLDIVVALTNCQRVVNFASTTFLKGFAAMLTAVRVVDNEVLWHLCFNPGGEYISYEDARASRGDETLPLGALVNARHIVGWTNHVRNYVGAPDADYAIEWTELLEPGPSCILEKVTLSGSVPFITPGGSFLVGVKDKPLHVGFGSGDDYMGTLMAIGKRFFVFYDSEEKRAWLVDGASAVLHLLRAYLKFYVEDRILGRYFMYSDGDITEVGAGVEYSGARAAFDILTNPRNQRLPLYPKGSVETEERTARLGKAMDATDSTIFRTTSSSFTLKDRVEQICLVLLQATAYQDDMNARGGFGFRIKSLPRHQIIGFEFMDVATRQETLVPKVATLQSMSVGWVHLVRSLRAVTLFGAGFGELLRPFRGKGQTHACCSATSSVPTGQDLLAVYGADLDEILRTGSKRRNPWRLAGDVHWHSPDGAAFHSCKCSADTAGQQGGSQSGKNGDDTTLTDQKRGLRGLFKRPGERAGQADAPGISDMVQVLLPTSFPKLYGRGLRSPARIVPEGAVVFGHCRKYPLRWSLTKDVPPEEGEPDPVSVDVVSGLMADSGIGTSVESSDSGPTPSLSPNHLYSLGSNVAFLHRDDSPQAISSEFQSNKGLDISGGGGKAVGHVGSPPLQTGPRKRPAVSLESSDSGAATKLRRVSSGSNVPG